MTDIVTVVGEERDYPWDPRNRPKTGTLVGPIRAFEIRTRRTELVSLGNTVYWKGRGLNGTTVTIETERNDSLKVQPVLEHSLTSSPPPFIGGGYITTDGLVTIWVRVKVYREPGVLSPRIKNLTVKVLVRRGEPVLLVTSGLRPLIAPKDVLHHLLELKDNPRPPVDLRNFPTKIRVGLRVRVKKGPNLDLCHSSLIILRPDLNNFTGVRVHYPMRVHRPIKTMTSWTS